MPQQEGLVAQARVKMGNAVRELIGALSVMKSVGTDEGKACITALKALSPVVPDVQESMGQSEIAAMLGGAPAVRPGPGAAAGMLGIPSPRPNIVAGPPMGGMMR